MQHVMEMTFHVLVLIAIPDVPRQSFPFFFDKQEYSCLFLISLLCVCLFVCLFLSICFFIKYIQRSLQFTLAAKNTWVLRVLGLRTDT